MRCRIAYRAILLFLVAATLLLALVGTLYAQQSQAPFAQSFSAREKIAAPIILCIDDKPNGGGQPSAEAYAKAAAHGFRSIVTLRSARDGIDPHAERFLVEQSKLRYFNIAAGDKLPERAQIDEFLRLARDPVNHPMLINCAFARRVAPFIMMFRIFEQGWSENHAIEQAGQSGLKKSDLKHLVGIYRASLNKKRAP
ncbi:MAG TPA: hypothetical protein VMT22_26295 [Terriglobales bacterium]|jgi:protein tyrosine phosphatase (PTP) superfamily phosphohydrolase (DUF442 family)|nr:hypothetical protein [Terriglobales bacterium]